MATNPSNATLGLTKNVTASPDSELQKAAGGVAVATDQREALQALLAFSTLHEQIRRRRTEEARRYAAGLGPAENDWEFEQFVLDEVLQLVAERALAITGADGIAIALADGDQIICRASAGTMAPDRGVRLDPKAGFSGACFRSGRIVRCDDSERDSRVNVEACRRLGTRSMVAVPLLGQENVVGLLEAFSTEPYGFNDSDVRGLNLLAELILAALKPEDEDRIVRAAKVAAAELQSAELESLRHIPLQPPPPQQPPATQLEDTPFEFSKESIAPELYQGSGERIRPAWLALLIVAICGTLLASGLWWRSRTISRGGVPAAAPKNATATAPSDTPSPIVSSDAQSAGSVSSSDNSGGKGPSIVPLVTGLRHEASGDASTVIIDLQQEVQYEPHHLSNPERIYFDLLDTALAPGLNGKIIDVEDGLIGRVRMAQPSDNVTRVVLDTKPGSRFTVKIEQNPYRLVIEVRAAELKAPAKTEPVAPALPDTKQPAATPAQGPTGGELSLRGHAPKLRIVLDAGHGGWDLGTVGREGLLEKNLVLEVAQRLGSLLENQLGCEVLYTRKDDNYVTLEQRAEMANQLQADLFISVHANYSSLISARGVETYYSSFFSAPEAREIEYRENANAKPVNHTKLTGSQLKAKVAESRNLAASVQRALYGTLSAQGTGIRNRGVKEKSFVVLTGTQMPSILAEISFVSSPADEERLQSADYRQKIAEALYKGVEHFAASSHRVKVASAAMRSAGQ